MTTPIQTFYICPTLKIDVRILTGNVLLDDDRIRLEDPNPQMEHLNLTAPLVVDLQLLRARTGEVILQGTVQGVQKLNCGRSLDEFEHAFEAPVKLVFTMDTYVKHWEMDDEADEDYVFRVNPQAQFVEISECIRQQIVLHEPLNPVKNPDDEFQWGSEEETEETGQAESTDPRWAKLLDLKKKMNSSDEK